MNKADNSLQKMDGVVRLGKPHGCWVSLYIKRKKILCVLVVNIFHTRVCRAPVLLSGLSGLFGLIGFEYHNDVATAVAGKKVANV